MRTWLIDIRNKSGKSQSEIAKSCNITDSYYCMIEQGKRKPSTDIAMKIANELNFDWTVFFTPKNNKTLII